MIWQGRIYEHALEIEKLCIELESDFKLTQDKIF